MKIEDSLFHSIIILLNLKVKNLKHSPMHSFIMIFHLRKKKKKIRKHLQKNALCPLVDVVKNSYDEKNRYIF